MIENGREGNQRRVGCYRAGVNEVLDEFFLEEFCELKGSLDDCC
jgi:hypothetical protein